MARFILSAFADEDSPSLDEQLQALKEEGIGLIEMRGVDGKNCAKLTLEEADAVKAKLDAAGIALSALGSPYGKAPLDEPFDEHLELFRHGLELCKHLGCKRIRMFSFFPPAGSNPASWREEVIRRLTIMLDLAEEAGIQLVHENEKEIYGDVTERCIDLLLQPPAPPKRELGAFSLRDMRVFFNSVNHSLELIRSAGVDAQSQRQETEREIVLTIRIPKREAAAR